MFIIPEKIWDEIKKLIPVKKSKVGRPQKDSKIALNGIFYIIKIGSQWSMLPTYYGAVSTIHGIFMKWIKSGVFKKILDLSIKFACKILGKPESFFTIHQVAKLLLQKMEEKIQQIEQNMELKKALL